MKKQHEKNVRSYKKPSTSGGLSKRRISMKNFTARFIHLIPLPPSCHNPFFKSSTHFSLSEASFVVNIAKCRGWVKIKLLAFSLAVRRVGN